MGFLSNFQLIILCSLPTGPPGAARSCLYDQIDLKDAEPDTLRYQLLTLPAWLVRHARARTLKISSTWL